MGDILTLAKKLERAMRNGTGFQITAEEVIASVEEGVAETINDAKIRKLKQQCLGRAGNTRSATIGSTSDGTESPRRSGRSVDIPRSLDQSFIAALSANA